MILLFAFRCDDGSPGRALEVFDNDKVRPIMRNHTIVRESGLGCKREQAAADYNSVKGWSWAVAGAVVKKLTENRQNSDARSAGKMASRWPMAGGRKGATLSQATVTTVPTAMLATAAAAVARFQKKAARITGVSAAE